MSNELSRFTDSVFEQIKKVNEYGSEYWLARELQSALDYSTWQKFVSVIRKAMLACNNSGADVDDHFNQTVNWVRITSGCKSART